MKMQETTRLDLDLIPDNDPSLKLFNPYQKDRLEDTTNLLEFLLFKGHLDTSHITGKVLNWGCGTGGECYIFRRNGADVTAIDKNPSDIDELLRAEILPKDRAICGDGNAYLRTKQADSHDLITAFMLTPSYPSPKWYKIVTDFYKESNRVIKPSGRILITSDEHTIEDVKKLLTGYGDYVDFGDPEVEPAFIGKKVHSVSLPSHLLLSESSITEWLSKRLYMEEFREYINNLAP